MLWLYVWGSGQFLQDLCGRVAVVWFHAKLHALRPSLLGLRANHRLWRLLPALVRHTRTPTAQPAHFLCMGMSYQDAKEEAQIRAQTEEITNWMLAHNTNNKCANSVKPATPALLYSSPATNKNMWIPDLVYMVKVAWSWFTRKPDL